MSLGTAVNERAFAERRQREWESLDEMVHRARSRGLKKLPPVDVAQLSPLYRDVCADLARAQAARYSAPLVEYLQALTASAHGVIYGAVRTSDIERAPVDDDLGGPIDRAIAIFPRAVRRHWKAVTIAAGLFFLPLFVGVAMSLVDPTFAFRIVPEAMLRPLVEAYQQGFDGGRGEGDDTMMAGFYINNNVGIALRCFALGILGGLGSAIYLVQNGLSIGAILGYVASQGAGGNIVTFIVGHGSLELGAIVIAGGAGLAMGWSIVAPGEKTRLASLQAVSRDVITLVFGAAVMLLMAAGIEAFWSGSSVPSIVKRVVGATLFVLLLAYLVLAGRTGKPAPKDDR